MIDQSALRQVARIGGVGLTVILGLIAILTALRTELPLTAGVLSDALGPESGELVHDYLDRAAESIADTTDEDAAPRWALVTAEQPWSIAEASTVVVGLSRVSSLYVQTPASGVAMPVMAQTLVEPNTGEVSRKQVFSRALHNATVVVEARAATGQGRSAQTEVLTAQRLRAEQPAIIGLVVWAESKALQDVAATPGVRAVEALPADAVWGRFAVRPLLPQQEIAADPLPDTAPIPQY